MSRDLDNLGLRPGAPQKLREVRQPAGAVVLIQPGEARCRLALGRARVCLIRTPIALRHTGIPVVNGAVDRHAARVGFVVFHFLGGVA